jgi:hypothetical protein
MKKKRGRTINIKINFSNRWLYFLITLGILAIVGVGVWAYGTSSPSTFGHSIGELEGVQARVTGTCAAGNSIRVINSDGSVTCEADTDTNTDYCSGGSCSGAISAPYIKLTTNSVSKGDWCSSSNWGEIRRCGGGASPCICYSDNRWHRLTVSS